MQGFFLSREHFGDLKRGALIFAFGLLLLIASSIAFRTTSAAEVAQNGHQINLMGRQRMLSQWITKQVVLIRAGMVDPEPASRPLETNLAQWERVQAGLESGDPELRLKVPSSAEVLATLWETRQSMNAIRATIRPLLESECRTAPTTCPLDVERLLEQEQRFLRAMDRAVSLEVEQDTEQLHAQSMRQYSFAALGLAITFFYGGYLLWRLPRQSEEMGMEAGLAAIRQ